MIKSILAYFGYIKDTDANLALHDLRKKAIELAITNRNLMEAADTVTKAHLSMHRQLVDAQKAQANAEEEIAHLKVMLRDTLPSPVTQKVTYPSRTVTYTEANLL